jgi:hypothetical protein
MSTVPANVLYLGLGTLAPFALTALYVSAMRGNAFESVPLHWLCIVGILASAVVFIAQMRASVVVRVVICLVWIPVIFIATQYFGALMACVVFGSCP